MPTILGVPTAQFLFTLIGAVTGAISGLVTAIMTDDDIAACVVSGAIEGAMNGITLDMAATGVAVPLSTTLAMSGLSAAAGELAYQSIKYGGVVDCGDVVIAGAMGTLTEGISLGIDQWLDSGLRAFRRTNERMYNRGIELIADGFEEAGDRLINSVVVAGRDATIVVATARKLLPPAVDAVSNMLTDDMKEKFDLVYEEISSMSPIERIMFSYRIKVG